MEKPISRKEFSDQSLKFFLSYSFFSFSVSGGLSSCRNRQSTQKQIIDEIKHLSFLLSKEKIKQTQWQRSIEQIFEKIDISDYLMHIDLESILKRYAPDRPDLKRIRIEKPIKFGMKKLVIQLFVLSKKRSIVPHGHNYMTSGFLILNGNFHGRHYQRLEDRSKHFIIRPSIDRNFSQGEFSTISDYKDNIHWFKANTDQAVILNIHLRDLKNGPKKPGRVYLNPLGGKYGGDNILAQRLSREQAYSMFF